jgi:tetratricopeptide (TPR) repeat protein
MANPVSNPEAEGRSDRLDELGKAKRLYRKRLREDPADAEALCGMGAVCQARGQLDEATAYYQEALRQRPNDPEACRSLGNAFYLGGKYAEAASCYQRTLRLRPDDADAHNNLGAALADLGRLEEAVACYKEALRLRPGFANAHYNLGNALRLSNRLEEAVASYQEALRLRPDFAEGYTNLGNALRLQGRLLEATACHQKAVQLAPGFALAQNNLGLALADSGRFSDALACYGEALRLDPNFAEAHRNRALVWLLLGDLERGWPEYDWRWRCADFSIPQFRQPAWDGSPLDGRTLLLYTEQGLGDTLLFVRFVPQVQERGGRVVLAAPESLHPILARCEGIARLVARNGALPEFDVHCPLLSLPRVLGTTFATIPAAIPYLHADPERVERWGRELGAVRAFKVGIAWQGNPAVVYDRERSIPLRQFAPLASVEGVVLFSLQKGLGTEQLRALAGEIAITDLGERLDRSSGAFEDTAAVLTHLDLVITCDTALAHLAGGLGVPTWVALPTVPDWRWFLGRDDSPWYPTVRLFRQTREKSWDEPFRRLAEELRKAVAAASGGRSIAVAITPGELLDRIARLEVENRRAESPEARAELSDLAATRDCALRSRTGLSAWADALRSVHEALRETRDALRQCEQAGDFGPRFVALARSLAHASDRRDQLRREINERLAGARREE